MVRGIRSKLQFLFEPRCEKTGLQGFQAARSLNMARGLKFRIKVEEVLYHPGSENKGTDQLRGCCEADLRLCFRVCKKPVFS